MTRFAVRAIFLALKGTAFLLGGLLFGVLPLVVVAAFKVVKVAVKVTIWTFGAVLVLMLGRTA